MQTLSQVQGEAVRSDLAVPAGTAQGQNVPAGAVTSPGGVCNP